jgi:hypothetical protein
MTTILALELISKYALDKGILYALQQFINRINDQS